MANGMSNGIDPKRFDPDTVEPICLLSLKPEVPTLSDSRTVVGFVGRLAKDKGIEEIFRAWTLLRDEFPDALLLLVGPWEEENKVSTAVRQGLESDPRVFLPGKVTDVAPFYKAMDFLVFPSHREGFPNAPMEAACMGLPVIATSVIGCVDAVVNYETGMLVPPRNVELLAKAIRRYLQDPELRRKHGQAGRTRVLRDFRPEAIWEALYHEYIRLLHVKGLPIPDASLQSPRLFDTVESVWPTSKIGDCVDETMLKQADLDPS